MYVLYFLHASVELIMKRLSVIKQAFIMDIPSQISENLSNNIASSPFFLLRYKRLDSKLSSAN
jgi:hypothetical protein